MLYFICCRQHTFLIIDIILIIYNEMMYQDKKQFLKIIYHFTITYYTQILF